MRAWFGTARGPPCRLHLLLAALLGRHAQGRNIVSTISDMYFGGARTQERAAGISLIGAGASRTGTQSITEALEVLGFSVYNMVSIMQHQHIDDVTSALQEPDRFASPLFTKVVGEGYSATLDTPMNMLWKEQLATFPEAKVLLSVRDSTLDWRKSFGWAADVFAPFHQSRPWKWIINLDGMLGVVAERLRLAGGGPASGCVDELDFVRPWWAPWVEYVDVQRGNPQCWERYYDGLRQEVERLVPSHQLLVFNVKQGWEPLCAFLNVSVPPQPFPRVNSARELTLAYYFLRVGCWIYPLVLLAPALCCAPLLFRRAAKHKEL